MNVFHRSGGGLHPHGMRTGGQIHLIRVVTAQLHDLPFGIVRKGVFFQFGKGIRPIDRDIAVTVQTAGHVLTHAHTKRIPAVGRHFDLPFDPLTGGRPVAATDGIEQHVLHRIGLGHRRGTVVDRVQHRIGFIRCHFPLVQLKIISFRSSIFRVIRIGGKDFRRGQQHFADVQTIILVLDRNGVFTGLQIDLHRIAVQILQSHGVPIADLHLRGTNVIAFFVGLNGKILVMPGAFQRHLIGLGIRQHAVQQHPYRRIRLLFTIQMIQQRDLIDRRLRDGDLPSDRFAHSIQQNRILALVNRHLVCHQAVAHRQPLSRRGGHLLFGQFGLVCKIGRQIRVGRLVGHRLDIQRHRRLFCNRRLRIHGQHTDKQRQHTKDITYAFHGNLHSADSFRKDNLTHRRRAVISRYRLLGSLAGCR